MPATTAPGQDYHRSGTLPDSELAELAGQLRAFPLDSDTSVELLTGQLTLAMPGEQLELC